MAVTMEKRGWEWAFIPVPLFFFGWNCSSFQRIQITQSLFSDRHCICGNFITMFLRGLHQNIFPCWWHITGLKRKSPFNLPFAKRAHHFASFHDHLPSLPKLCCVLAILSTTDSSFFRERKRWGDPKRLFFSVHLFKIPDNRLWRRLTISKKCIYVKHKIRQSRNTGSSFQVLDVAAVATAADVTATMAAL